MFTHNARREMLKKAHNAVFAYTGEKKKLNKPRMLTPEESAAKAKSMGLPIGKEKALSEAKKSDYQRRVGKAYSE